VLSQPLPIRGTWVPSVGGSATYSVQTGKYTKIGNFIFFSGEMTITVIGSGSLTTIAGLPFPADVDNAVGAAVLTFFSGLSLAVVDIVGEVGNGSLSIFLRSMVAAAAGNALNNVLTSGTALRFSGQYRSAG
jgi:hypothetical protein